MPESITQLVNDLLDAWNAHDLARAETFYAADYTGVDVGQAAPQHGPRGRGAVLATYIRAFPDVSFSGDILVQGERAVLVWTMHGTHRGTFMRIPPTGRRVQVRGVSILTIRDGKVKDGLNIWDTAGLLRGLGLLPEL